MATEHTNNGNKMNFPTETPIPASAFIVDSKCYPYTPAARMAAAAMETRTFIDPLVASQLFDAARKIYSVERKAHGQRFDDWQGRSRWAENKWGGRFFGILIDLGGRQFELRSFGRSTQELVEVV